MRYWTIVNGVPTGPMTFEDLTRVAGFGPDTPVWREGLDDWTTASRLPDTAHLFAMRPQPAYAPGTPSPQPAGGESMPRTYIVWAVISTLCCCLPTGIVALIYSSKVSPLWHRGDYDGARRASDKAGWWVIISFVAGFVWAPFSFLWTLLTA